MLAKHKATDPEPETDQNVWVQSGGGTDTKKHVITTHTLQRCAEGRPVCRGQRRGQLAQAGELGRGRRRHPNLQPRGRNPALRPTGRGLGGTGGLAQREGSVACRLLACEKDGSQGGHGPPQPAAPRTSCNDGVSQTLSPNTAATSHRGPLSA